MKENVGIVAFLPPNVHRGHQVVAFTEVETQGCLEPLETKREAVSLHEPNA